MYSGAVVHKMPRNSYTVAQREAFGKNLRDRILETGMHPSEFARVVGFTRDNVSTWCGDRSHIPVIPSAHNLQKLVDYFKCLPDDLVPGWSGRTVRADEYKSPIQTAIDPDDPSITHLELDMHVPTELVVKIQALLRPVLEDDAKRRRKAAAERQKRAEQFRHEHDDDQTHGKRSRG